jgi:predicted metal-dependent phosphotriesterase family hydrolase
MNLGQMQKAVEMGAYLEFVSGFVREEATIAEHVETIRAIGPEHSIVSSDRGQGRGPEGHESRAQTHVEGLAAAARVLRDHGFTERELDIMFKENPARLLGLPVP